MALRIGVQNSQASRRAMGLIQHVCLLPADHEIASIVDKCGQDYNDRKKAGKLQVASMGQPHADRWLSVVRHLAGVQTLPEATRTLFSQHLAQYSTAKDLGHLVQDFHCFSTWDRKQVKLTVAVEAELKPVEAALLHALSLRGATVTHGCAPPGPLERAGMQALIREGVWTERSS